MANTISFLVNIWLITTTVALGWTTFFSQRLYISLASWAFFKTRPDNDMLNWKCIVDDIGYAGAMLLYQELLAGAIILGIVFLTLAVYSMMLAIAYSSPKVRRSISNVARHPVWKKFWSCFIVGKSIFFVIGFATWQWLNPRLCSIPDFYQVISSLIRHREHVGAYFIVSWLLCLCVWAACTLVHCHAYPPVHDIPYVHVSSCRPSFISFIDNQLFTVIWHLCFEHCRRRQNILWRYLGYVAVTLWRLSMPACFKLVLPTNRSRFWVDWHEPRFSDNT